MKNIFSVLVLSLLLVHVSGQNIKRHIEPSEPQPIRKSEVREMVENLADSIAMNYVDASKALLLKEKLLSELKSGSLNKFTEKQALASHLSENLVAWSNDKHFNITLAGQRRMMPRSYDHFASQNYFFEKIEHLPGNIAYVKFDRFIPPSNAGSLVVSAMLFAANSEAVIIDLRENMGGSPQTASMLAGFFMEKPTLININENRATGVKQETWSAETSVTINSTNQEISTKDLDKLKNVPVYILTSDYTFSAAEMFSSSLQGHGRAVVVGEATGGGGHGIRPFKIAEGFTAFIPFNRHYHPVTKKGWEVVGVEPDISCDATDALRTAQVSILKELQNKPDQDSNITELLKELEDAKN
jgi:C-terminal processing protease CtpA/Prc